jgi:hypothetical protein
MISLPNRFVLAGGLLITALAIAALGVHLSIDGFSGRASSRDDVSLSTPPDSSPVRAGRTQPVPTSTSDAGIAYVLQAVHDSLQRNDLASARVLLDAVLAIRSDEPQALILQKELIARQEQAHAAASVASAAPAPKAAEPVRATVRPTGKTERTRDTSTHAAHSRTQTTQRNESVDGDSTHVEAPHSVRPSDAMLPTASSTISTTAATVSASTSAPAAHPTPQVSETTTPTVPPTHTDATSPVIQTAQSNPAPAVYGQGPKTRAEVRDELVRARTDGSMSRFGNPDPKGPGGTPSYNAQPSVRLDR